VAATAAAWATWAAWADIDSPRVRRTEKLQTRREEIPAAFFSLERGSVTRSNSVRQKFLNQPGAFWIIHPLRLTAPRSDEGHPRLKIPV